MSPYARGRGAAVSVVLVVLAGLAACGGEDEPGGVLHEDDLPAVARAVDGKNLPAVAVCGAIKDAEFSITIGNQPAAVTREFTLESGDYVGSSLLGTPRRYGTSEKAVARVADAIQECAVPDAAGDETFTALTDLPDGAIGYRSTSTTSNGPRVGERVFVTRGDRIVVVGTRHDGDGDPDVDVAELLPTALDRAEDAPKG